MARGSVRTKRAPAPFNSPRSETLSCIPNTSIPVAPLPPSPTILTSVSRNQTNSTLASLNLQSAVQRGGGDPLM